MDGPTRTQERGNARHVEDASEISVVVVGRDGTWQAVLPDDRAIYIGTREDCDVVVTDDAAVSRRHVMLRRGTRGVEVTDLESKNGTWLGTARIQTVVVRPPIHLRIGDCIVRLVSRAAAEPVAQCGELYAVSAEMRALFDTITRVAASEIDVLVHGETGTGKELVAHALHALSSRAAAPWVVIDAAAIPNELMESELFGHVRGAFTGANSDRPGAFESARNGTVFIDEIGELSPAVQPKLLRAVEARQTKRVGANSYHTFAARLITATHRDLQAGGFREDLYHRISGLVIEIPPLRERRADIEMLVARFAAPDLVFPADVLDALVAYDWPGNVRQLRKVIERANVLAADRVVTCGLLGLDGKRVTKTELAPFKDAKQRLVDAWERDYLVALLERAGGNLSAAARSAGIARAHLHRLLSKHELQTE